MRDIKNGLTPNETIAALRRRLDKITDIIEAVEIRCAAADGPVAATLEEMTSGELRLIYRLAKGIVID